MNPIIIVQGAQYGSEGKGQVAANLCQERHVDFAIRTGAINAGHTVFYDGKPYKMQQLPTGWVNPDTKLVIGPGAYIHPDILRKEIEMVEAATGEPDLRKRLLIDFRCSTHSAEDELEAKKAGRHLSMGATGKGCAEAILAKIRNRPHQPLFRHYVEAQDYALVDTQDCLIPALQNSAQLLIEGTQGTLLDLHTGPYPYVTSRMTSAANWVAEAGLSPAFKYEVVLVARTYPIRVAGYSGPMPEETSWPTLLRVMNVKRMTKGLGPLVQENTIEAFEECVRVITARAYAGRIPKGSDGLDQHRWSEIDRMNCKEALSSINADALSEMQLKYPTSYGALIRVVELTTVTKKLRRISHINREILRKVVRAERPSSLVLTFLNYQFPELWRGIGPHSDFHPQVDHYLSTLMSDLGGTPIDYVTVGPLPEHQLRYRL